MNGKHVKDIPDEAYTIMIASVTGWSPEIIDRLSQKQFLTYAPMCELVFKNRSAHL